MESLTLELVGMLFFAGLVGGFVDSIAGGGGLITVPMLLALGVPPVSALATNKAQAMFGSFIAMQRYAQKGHVNLREMKLAIGFTVVGAATGTVLAQRIPADLLMQVMPFLLIAAALYFSLGPKIGDHNRHHKMETTPFYAVFGLIIGFYDGFFGPGTGSFWTLVFVMILGFNMLKATAHTKVVNFTSNITSFLFFAFSGYVLWLPAAVMALGQLVGARLGANMAMKHGTSLIRPLLVTVSLVITAQLVYNDPHNIMHIWIQNLLSL
ncbi:MAG: TSUP family transporter [Magnetovibrio sp.]|nr:TSUP family transporter [Magnetovibrio sp.]